MAASLLMMVAGLTKTRTGDEKERAALAEARATLTSCRERLMGLADKDSEAFNAVMAAYRSAKATDEEKATRKQAIQRALHGATETPLETLRAVVEATGHARVVAQYGNVAAASDVRVALELLESAASGAAANVQTNLQTIDDEAFRKTAADQIVELTNRSTEDAAAARAVLP